LTLDDLSVATDIDDGVVALPVTTTLEHLATHTVAAHLWRETAIAAAALTVAAFSVFTADVVGWTLLIHAATAREDFSLAAGLDDGVVALTVTALVEHVATDAVATYLGLETAFAIAAGAVAALVIFATDIVAGAISVAATGAFDDLIVATCICYRAVALTVATLLEHVATDAVTADLGIKTTVAAATFAIAAFAVFAAGIVGRAVHVDAAHAANDFVVAARLARGVEALAVATGVAEVAARVVTADLRRETAIASTAIAVAAFVVVATGVSRRTVEIGAT